MNLTIKEKEIFTLCEGRCYGCWTENNCEIQKKIREEILAKLEDEENERKSK